MEKKLSLTDSLSWIKKGKILIHPTESIWGIGCDAFNEETVKKIYELKKRPKEKSFILLSPSLEITKKYISKLNSEEEEYVNNLWPGHVTVLFKYNKNLPDHLKNKSGKIAIRVSNHLPINKLLTRFNGLLVSTSANLSGQETENDTNILLKIFNNKNVSLFNESLGKNKRPSKIIDLETRITIRE